MKYNYAEMFDLWLVPHSCAYISCDPAICQLLLLQMNIHCTCIEEEVLQQVHEQGTQYFHLSYRIVAHGILLGVSPILLLFLMKSCTIHNVFSWDFFVDPLPYLDRLSNFPAF